MAIKQALKLVCKECVVIAFLVILGTVLIILAYMLPTDKIRENVAKGAPLFESEGTYPQLIYGNSDSQLDNWTDALMLQIAAGGDSSNIVQSAMLNPYLKLSDLNPAERLVKLYSGRLDAGEGVYTEYYGRYWHGYNIYLKPLLCIFDYQTIRYLLMVVQVCMLTSILILSGKCGGGTISIYYRLYSPICFVIPWL